MSETPVSQYERIFSKFLPNKPSDGTVPVASSLQTFYQTKANLLASSQARRQSIEEKNRRIQTENMKYRSSLDKKIRADLEKHSRNREGNIKKLIQTERRKNNQAKAIYEQYQAIEKGKFKDRIKEFKQSDEQMIRFWQEQQQKRDKSYQTQSAAKTHFQSSVERKKLIQEKNNDLGLQTKSNLIRKHSGRVHVVHNQLNNKRYVNQIHSQQIAKNNEKHHQMKSCRQERVINAIGTRFTVSELLVKKNKGQLEKKIKEKIYDRQQKQEAIKQRNLDRMKQKSQSLADCRCKRSFYGTNQRITKSKVFNDVTDSPESPRSENKRNSLLKESRREFMVRSQSVRSTVNYNVDNIREKKYNADVKWLKRQRQIGESIKMKKRIEIEGNCYVRMQNVK